MVNKLSPTLFARRVLINQDNGCWDWQPSTQTAGYGSIKISGEKKIRCAEF
jgi:hypothetical protein